MATKTQFFTLTRFPVPPPPSIILPPPCLNVEIVCSLAYTLLISISKQQQHLCDQNVCVRKIFSSVQIKVIEPSHGNCCGKNVLFSLVLKFLSSVRGEYFFSPTVVVSWMVAYQVNRATFQACGLECPGGRENTTRSTR